MYYATASDAVAPLSQSCRQPRSCLIAEKMLSTVPAVALSAHAADDAEL
jgi:hypothetical protein